MTPKDSFLHEHPNTPVSTLLLAWVLAFYIKRYPCAAVFLLLFYSSPSCFLCACIAYVASERAPQMLGRLEDGGVEWLLGGVGKAGMAIPLAP